MAYHSYLGVSSQKRLEQDGAVCWLNADTAVSNASRCSSSQYSTLLINLTKLRHLRVDHTFVALLYGCSGQD